MSDAELKRLAERMQEVLGKQAVGPKLAPELKKAVDAGITNGQKPGAFCTKAEVAAMIQRKK